MTSWTCSGWSLTEYHSARAAARRLPFSDSGRCSTVEQRNYFLSRGDVRLDWPRAERRLVEIVECGQAAREKFAIDHALGEAVDPAEAHTLRQFGQPLAN